MAQNSNVTVPCPKLSGMEMDFTLYKGPDKVTSIYVNITNTLVSKHNDSPMRDFPANLSVNFTDNSANFILFSVTINITALYTCEAERNFPPPLVKVEQTPQIVVFVQGKLISLLILQLCSKKYRNSLQEIYYFY